MTLKEFPQIQERISNLSQYTQMPESRCFDTSDIYSYLSTNNQELLFPIEKQFKNYLNCLKNVSRWKEHIYQDVTKNIHDNDYQHTLEMLKINQEMKNMELDSICFDDVELMILIHDGGEIITDDVSSNHPEEMDNYIKTIKQIESRSFGPYVLRSLSEKSQFATRSKIRNLYQRYESRETNPNDKESHLTKFIDILQGNEFGLKNVYSKKHLIQTYGPENIPGNSDTIIFNMIDKEIYHLTHLLPIIDNSLDKQNFFSYYFDNYFNQYNHPDYGYQHIYNQFLKK